MSHHLTFGTRAVGRLTMLLLLAAPAWPAEAVDDAPRSTLQTYTPTAVPSPQADRFQCENCWDLTREPSRGLPQHVVPRYRRSRHTHGPRPHKDLLSKRGGLRALPRHKLTPSSGEHRLDDRLVRKIDGDTIRYGADRIRIRGYNAPELSEPGGRDAALRLESLLRESTVTITPQGRDVYGRTLADVYVDGRNIADVMTEEGFGRKRS